MKLKRYAALTHQGPYLNINEDSYDIDIKNKLYMILDGFGGAGFGDVCVAKVKENIRKFYLNASHDKEATMPFFFSQRYLIEGNALVNATQYAHHMLCQDNNQHEMLERAGASGIIVSEAENLMTLVSVGNCEAYFYRQGRVHKIFSEETQFLLMADTATRGMTLPTNALGLFEELEVQTKEIRILAGDQILLLSDGIYAKLNAHDIDNILKNSELTHHQKVKKLLDLSNERGNLDNQTVLLLEY
ncbi:MAG: protein phosphatase 2C domain-containing protein [Bacteriovoracaceae bacterium]|nr:protein phosphatase 2C domain-containing protein [Bacteriovoracaceae bacterium]